jgi:hypothetical protein
MFIESFKYMAFIKNSFDIFQEAKGKGKGNSPGAGNISAAGLQGHKQPQVCRNTYIFRQEWF